MHWWGWIGIPIDRKSGAVAATAMKLSVAVPEGIGPGDEFLIEGPDGQHLTVVCPEGGE